MARLPRRDLLRLMGTTAVAATCGAITAGCAANAALAVVPRPAVLQVALVGGLQTKSRVVGPGYLAALAPLLQSAFTQAAHAVPQVKAVDFSAMNDPSTWFPPPTTLFNASLSQAARVDDPHLPMPDVVVALHGLLPNFLANRALDLTGRVHADNLGALPGLRPATIGCGAAVAYQQGEIQAGLPLLRAPLLCAVQPGVVAVQGGKRVWSAETFLSTLEGLAPSFVAPSAPILAIPYGYGAATLAALGQGGQLGQASAGGYDATFASGAALQGLWATAQWARYAVSQPIRRNSSFTYGVVMWDGAELLQARGPLRFGPQGLGPVPAGWSLAPVPAFSTPVTPVQTVDALISKHSPHPDAAWALLTQMLTSDVQKTLAPYTGGLSVLADVATGQLDALGNVQGASALADGAHDASVFGGFKWGIPGAKKAQVQGLALAEQNLMAALDSLLGSRGEFWSYERLAGPVPSFGTGFVGGPSPQSPPDLGTLGSTLAAAAAATSQGTTWNPPLAGT